jgi:hypothetical protein
MITALSIIEEEWPSQPQRWHARPSRERGGRTRPPPGRPDRGLWHAAGGSSQAARTTIPILMVCVADPVRAGLVTSLARPGGNITGNTVLSPISAPSGCSYCARRSPRWHASPISPIKQPRYLRRSCRAQARSCAGRDRDNRRRARQRLRLRRGARRHAAGAH